MSWQSAFLVLGLMVPCGGAHARQTVTTAFISHPVGALVRYDLDGPIGSGFEAGLYDEFLFYSNGVGLKLGLATDPAWLKLSLDLGIEPGWFMKLAPGEGYREDGQRTFGVRYLGRAQLYLNIRTDRWWLYGRTTGQYRRRNFREADTFQGIALGEEISIEQAYALMRRIGGTNPVAFWAYLEHTVGYLRGHGTRPNRLSGGLVAEGWPNAGTVLNLDLYYSVASPPLEGPGVLLSWVVGW